MSAALHSNGEFSLVAPTRSVAPERGTYVSGRRSATGKLGAIGVGLLLAVVVNGLALAAISYFAPEVNPASEEPAQAPSQVRSVVLPDVTEPPPSEVQLSQPLASRELTRPSKSARRPSRSPRAMRRPLAARVASQSVTSDLRVGASNGTAMAMSTLDGGLGETSGAADYGSAGYDHIFDEGTADVAPSVKTSRNPTYPMRAQRRGIEGSVVVRALIGVDGAIEEIQVVSASPEGVFEETVKRALRGWEFKPAQHDGKPVRAWIRTTFDFGL